MTSALQTAFRRVAARVYRRQNRLDDALKEHLLLARLEPRAPEHDLSCGDVEQRNNSDKALRRDTRAAQ